MTLKPVGRQAFEMDVPVGIYRVTRVQSEFVCLVIEDGEGLCPEPNECDLFEEPGPASGIEVTKFKMPSVVARSEDEAVSKSCAQAGFCSDADRRHCDMLCPNMNCHFEVVWIGQK